jgi:hypothetical protein
MSISVMEAIKKIVEVNGDEAQALAITVVKGDVSYTGIIGVDPMKISMNALKLVAAMQSTLEREFSITQAILRGMDFAGVNIVREGGSCVVPLRGVAKPRPEQTAPDESEVIKGLDRLLEEIFKKGGTSGNADD